MEYKISYNSHNQYFEFVKDGFFEFLILPENSEQQMVSAFKFKNSQNVEPFYYTNMFGFRVCRLRISSPFKELKLEMNIKVQKGNHGIINGYIFDIKESHQILNDSIFKIDNHLFLQKTSYTTLTDSNFQQFPLLKTEEHPYKYLTNLNKFINNFFTYTPNSTTVSTTANDLIDLKKGVCQDYAHLMLSVARHQNIPSRYVSGFLHQNKDYIGASKMHAWIECLIPGAGWIGFDPTNNLNTDEHYIKVAHGCDYSDCTPLKGIIRTNGKQLTDHEVIVHAQ